MRMEHILWPAHFSSHLTIGSIREKLQLNSPSSVIARVPASSIS